MRGGHKIYTVRSREIKKDLGGIGEGKGGGKTRRGGGGVRPGGGATTGEDRKKKVEKIKPVNKRGDWKEGSVFTVL